MHKKLRRGLVMALIGLLGGYAGVAEGAPEPLGWFTGDIHAHRSCGGSPETVQSIYDTMVAQDLNVISLLADMGNGEVQNPATDLPKVNGQDDGLSTAGRIIHWDTEWHWDATYTQYPHQALGGHIVALGLTNAYQIWDESTDTIFQWAHQQGAMAGFAHFQYLDDGIPTSLSCCTPIEYPVEVALGACDFISEDVNGGDAFIHAYYRLLNCGFRPGFAAGSDHPCAANIGTMLTYSQVAGGVLTYSNWIQGIKQGRTVVSRNGRNEFLDLKVNGTAGPGDEIQLTGGGTVQVSLQWLVKQNLTGRLELVQNGVVISSQDASAASGSPVTLNTAVNFSKSGWLCARLMDANGHRVHTAAVFVTVDGAPVRASAADAQFYVQWMDMLLENTAVGGAWAAYYPTERAAAQSRFSAARAIFQQIAIEAGAQPAPQVSIGNGAEGVFIDYIWSAGAWINAGRFQALSNMTVSVMEAKVGAVAGKYKCAIYTDNSGQPNRLLGGTLEVANASDGWQSFPLAAPLSLTNGSYYWLAIWSDDANGRVYYSDNGGTLRWGQYAYGDWPDPLTTVGGGNLNYCIYATGAGASLTNITVSPSNPTIPSGGSQQFTATGTYSDGSTQNLSSSAVWTSSSPAVATVNGVGLATGISAGTTTISATLAGQSGSSVLTVQAGPLAITTATLPDGVLNTAYTAVLAGSGGTAPYTWSIASGSLPAGLTLNSTSGAIGGTPTSTGTSSFTVQLSDGGNPVQAMSKALAITVSAAPAVVSIWADTAVPATVDGGADSPVEVGVKFRSDVAGYVRGIRFYKASANNGTHVGNLWNEAGALLGSATFVNETGSGWQEVLFSTPVPLAANTVYVASYHTVNGHYSADENYFAAAGVDHGPLHALADGVSGGNGVYAYGASSVFPNLTWVSANYWVDVVFQAGEAPTLTSIVVTPASSMILPGGSQQFTATGNYSDGSAQNLSTQATWTSSNTTVATVNNAGLATGAAVGTTTIAATVGQVSGGSTLTVTNAATLTSIALTPANPTVLVGGTQQFTATGTFSDSSTQNLTSLATWISSNATVATVSVGGLASGVSVGSTTIAAVMSGVVGSTSVAVTAPPVGLGDYRSVGSGLWNNAGTWQTNNGTAWVNAAVPPNNSATAGVITIQNGHTVIINAGLTADQVLVQAGGQITVSNVTLTVANGAGADLDVFGKIVLMGASGVVSVSSGATVAFKGGGVYQHARTAGTIPTATWDTNSTCLITGSTTGRPGGLGQTFGHFTWNCTGQTSALNLETSLNVAGNLTVSSTGSSTLRIANGATARVVTVGGSFTQTAGRFVVASGTAASTLNVGGNFSLSGGTFILKDSSGAGALNITGDFSQTGGLFDQRAANATSTAIVTVARHFSLTAGTYDLSGVAAVGTLNLGGNLTHTGGTLTETSSGSGSVVFTSGLHTNASGGTVSGAINFTVNSGATLMLGTSLLGDGSSGTFTLSAGGTLGIGDPLGITTSGATGNVRVTGTRSYNTAANYLYNGSTAQVPGNGLPATVNNLTVANPVGLVVNSTNTVTGTALVSTNGLLLGNGRINTGDMVLNGVLSPGVGVGRLTTAREVWNGGGRYVWELKDATGVPGSGWDLVSLTNGQGIDVQATAANPFTLKLVTLNGSNPGQAANFGKTNSYTWTIAVATNASVTNFVANRFVVDATGFSNDFGAGTFSLETEGNELRLHFAGEPSGLTFVTTSLSNAVQNSTYTAALNAIGGTAPYDWSISNGILPGGLTLNHSNGVISGTATATGTYNFTVAVSDSGSPKQMVSSDLSILVVPALSSIVVTPANSTLDTGNSQQFTASGIYSDGSSQNISGQVSWTSANATVASINASGLATALTAGTTTISASLAGVVGSALLTAQSPLMVVTASLPSGTVSSNYAATLMASGGITPYVWSISSGTLPAGLSLNAASGMIAGNPSVAGTVNFTVQVTDASIPTRSATRSLELSIAPNLVAVAVTPASATNLVGGTQQFTATGTYSDGTTQNLSSLATWVSSSTATATINSAGLASGKAAGVTTISATVGGVVGNATLRIEPTPLKITTPSLANGVVGSSYTGTLVASGGTPPYSWALADGALPAGLTLNSGGTISGTPTAAGTANFTVRVSDAGNSPQMATNAYGLTVNSGAPAGVLGNTADGNLTDALWFSGPWINACRFLANSNTLVSAIEAKVMGIEGNYKCAIYTDGGSQPDRLLRSTVEVNDPVTGWQNFPLTSSVVLTNGEYYWLAVWSDSVNAQIFYSGNGGTLSWQQANYGAWPDPMAVTGSGSYNYCIYATGLGSLFLGVEGVSPLNGATRVSLTAPVTATFSSDMAASTINSSTVLLKDAEGNLVSGNVSYNEATKTASLVPAAPLKAASAYVGTIKGGAAGVANLAGSVMSADFTWEFRTDMYGNGPGGPILIVTQPTNGFSRYYAEILLAEGLNEFAITNLPSVTSDTLANFDVVLLGQTALTSSQVSMFTTWVNAGGKLIAMRPDKQLAGLLGLSDAGVSLAEGYMLVNTTTGPGVGIVNQTMQFHGTADRYSLGSASSLATLYSSPSNVTPNPAVTLRNVGSNGGQAAAFTYDLARSIVYTRQGNPSWAGQERDGIAPMRPDDLFFGAKTNDMQTDWVNLDKVAIPQADEQQRLLANLILAMESTKALLPRFWYFPHGYPAVVVMTGDDHSVGGTNAVRRFNQYLAASAPGGSLADWQLPRCTMYTFLPNPGLNDSQAATYQSAGFEIGIHLYTGCADYTPGDLAAMFAQQFSDLRSYYPSVALPVTDRIHCIAWSGYSEPAEVSSQWGVRLDTSYYYWPTTWVNNRPGFMTGSGMPMRFATTNGSAIDIFQAATQMTDESGQSYPYTIDTLLDRALGADGFFGAFVANMHTDANVEPEADAILASALARGVPVIAANQLLTWVDARNNSSIKSVNWDGSRQNFSIVADTAAHGLMAMSPIPAGYTVAGVIRNGSPVELSLVTVKGVRYALFYSSNGNYQVSYALDSIPPSITSVSPANGATGVDPATSIRVDFSESLDAATVNNSTVVLYDSLSNPVAGTVTYDPSTHEAILQPSVSLLGSQTYTVGVQGGESGIRDFAGNPLPSNYAWTFTTAAVTAYSFWSGSAIPSLVDGGADNPVQLGIKFRSDVAGYVTGIRFYKASANIGTHVAGLWTSTGTRLGAATFVGESASGWQQVNFATPIAIAANTEYVASYHATVGHYSADTDYFEVAGWDAGPLHVPSSGSSGGNGVYAYGDSTTFPNFTWQAANYWVDIVFQPAIP